MTAHKWQFVARFRYHVFGWQPDKTLQRIKEALSGIKRVAKKEPELAVAGAVLFYKKFHPPSNRSQWADEFMPSVEQVSKASGYAHFKGSSAYLTSLHTAERYEELLAMLEKSYLRGWWYRQ